MVMALSARCCRQCGHQRSFDLLLKKLRSQICVNGLLVPGQRLLRALDDELARQRCSRSLYTALSDQNVSFRRFLLLVLIPFPDSHWHTFNPTGHGCRHERRSTQSRLFCDLHARQLLLGPILFGIFLRRFFRRLRSRVSLSL